MSSPLPIKGFGTSARFLIKLHLLLPLLFWRRTPLTLRQAVDLALHSNPLVAASDAGEKEAEARIREVHSGYLPRLQFSESLQRGNNPVFVFSSLLTQHQFTDANFAIGSLNRPDAMNNYQSQLTVEQVVFDARQTSRSIEAARFTRRMAGEDTVRAASSMPRAVNSAKIAASFLVPSFFVRTCHLLPIIAIQYPTYAVTLTSEGLITVL
jgi:hypothetical protein